MAIGKRSLMNEHMIVVLNKVKSMDPNPIQKSYLYYSQAEKEEVDYMISVDLLKEVSFTDDTGSQKKGYVLGEFGRKYIDMINELQIKVDCQEQAASGKSVDETEMINDYNDRMAGQIEELDNRGSKKMETINKWKQQKKGL